MTAGSDSERVSSRYRSSTCRSLSNMGRPHGALGSRRRGGRGDGLALRRATAWRGAQPAGTLPLRERLPLVFPLEPLDAAGRVQELLLAREEGMALGAHLHPDL